MSGEPTITLLGPDGEVLAEGFDEVAAFQNREAQDLRGASPGVGWGEERFAAQPWNRQPERERADRVSREVEGLRGKS
jgi:hypothetical protein